MRRNRFSIKVTTVVLAGVTYLGAAGATASAWYLTNDEATFFWLDAKNLCYTNRTFIQNPSGLARATTDSHMRDLNSSDVCLAGTGEYGGASWVGSKVWIVKQNGTVCRVSDWRFNNTGVLNAPVSVQQGTGGCHGTIQGQGRSKGWRPSTTSYVSSNIRQTPAHAWP